MHVPPRIPGFELHQSLGGGPLTRVYAAHDCTADQPCAVKVIRDECRDDSTAIKLLQREARAGLAVRHPYVVRIQDAHVTRAPHYLVMEFLRGESLRRRLRREYTLDVATGLWITRQIAEALAALHRAGFIHGDVKPDNVRLTDPGTAVLIDLGFAHRPGENASLRQRGYVLGTASYLAPELCAGNADGDFRSDVYSLGVTLFEMLTGRLPFPTGTVEQTLLRHLSDPPLRIVELAGPLPPMLVSLVARLLSKHPHERPKAVALVQQLIGLELSTMRRRAA